MGFYPPLFAVLFVLFSVAVSFGEEDSVSLYLKAGELEEAGDYKAAADILKTLLVTEKSSHLYTRLTELLLASENGDEAFNILKEAEKNFPDEPYFKFTIGQIYEFHKKDPEAALGYYVRAAELSSDPRYHLAAAHVLEVQGKYDKALKILDALIEKNPSPAHYSDRGRIYLRMGKRDSAVADFKKAMDTGGDMGAMLRLADIYLSEGNKAEAKIILERIAESGRNFILPELKLGEIYKEEKDYKKAIELYSSVADRLSGKDRAAVLKQLGALQYETGDYENAARSFEWVTELTPEDSMSAYSAGYIYEHLGKKEKAKEIYERALKVHPTYAQLLKRMAAIYLLDEKLDEALKYIGRIDPLERDVDYYMICGEVYNMKKDHNKAALILIEGLAENPTDTGILYSLAMQYELLKERTKAVETMKRAIGIEPDNPVFQNFLGYIYADLGINLEEAYIFISKALTKDPTNPAYLDSMAWVLFRQKEYNKALEYAEKAFKVMPDDPEVSSHIKAIKEKLGK